jgi:hypothetical protein
LTGDQTITGFHGVLQANVDGRDATGVSELVHLRFVGKAGLHHTETAHGTAGRIVRTHGITVDGCDLTRVRALHVGNRIDEHSR